MQKRGLTQVMIYFDHASAALPSDLVWEHYFHLCREFGGANPESAHALGRRIRQALDASAERLREILELPDNYATLWFTGAADSFNFLAEIGLFDHREVLSSRLEHPALAAALRRTKAKIRIIDNDAQGKLQLPAAPEKAAVVALTQLQSELGTIVDFAAIRSAFPRALILADSVQAAGKIALPREAQLIVISGSKFGAPGGGSALFFDRTAPALKNLPELYRRRRSVEYLADRVAAPPLLVMEVALRERLKNCYLTTCKVARINQLIRSRAAELGARETIPAELASPYICHLNFPGKQGAVLARMLSERDIMVSAGSACAAESKEPSPALRALGFSTEAAYSGLRLSFSASNEEAEAEKFLRAMAEIIRNY